MLTSLKQPTQCDAVAVFFSYTESGQRLLSVTEKKGILRILFLILFRLLFLCYTSNVKQKKTALKPHVGISSLSTLNMQYDITLMWVVLLQF